MKLLLIVISFIVWMEVNEQLLSAFNHPWFIGEAMISIIVMVAWTLIYAMTIIKIVTYKKESK